MTTSKVENTARVFGAKFVGSEPLTLILYYHCDTGGTTFIDDYHRNHIMWGVRYLTGEKLKVILAKFSTLS